jgi:hypothetical protein
MMSISISFRISESSRRTRLPQQKALQAFKRHNGANEARAGFCARSPKAFRMTPSDLDANLPGGTCYALASSAISGQPRRRTAIDNQRIGH